MDKAVSMAESSKSNATADANDSGINDPGRVIAGNNSRNVDKIKSPSDTTIYTPTVIKHQMHNSPVYQVLGCEVTSADR